MVQSPPALHSLPSIESDEEDALEQAVRRYRDEIIACESAVKLGADPEAVHLQRVATRRLRSLLGSSGPLSSDPERAHRLSEELRWLARALGKVRDRDVLIAYLLDELVSLDEAGAFGAVLELLDDERQEARAKLRDVLDSARYRNLLHELAQPPRLREGEDLRSPAITEYQRLREAVEQLDDDPADLELHEVRIQVKRARYAAGAAGASLRYVERARALQDILGEHQDASVAERQIGEMLARVRGTRRTAVAAGRLIERQRRRRIEARRLWKKAWKRVTRAAEAEWS